jgi:hypothetical protein
MLGIPASEEMVRGPERGKPMKAVTTITFDIRFLAHSFLQQVADTSSKVVDTRLRTNLKKTGSDPRSEVLKHQEGG